MRGFVQSIFCDSKATSVFSITLKYWRENLARQVGQHLAKVASAHKGGHNGITVAAATRGPDDIFGDSDRRIDFDPDWAIDNV